MSRASSGFPRKGSGRKAVRANLGDALEEDFSFGGGRVLGSMCTAPLPIAVEAHSKFIESNLGNSGLYPGTAKLERQVVAWVSDLMHGRNLAGHVVGGGTEANITALWVARNATGKKEVVFPESAHFSFSKACDLLGMKPVIARLNDDFTVDVDDARRKIGKNTAAVVGIAGTTEVGAVDDVAALAEASEGKTLHVDAAFGGFVIPFLCKLGGEFPGFDFSVPGVSSLTIDPHKMGMATVPSGILLFRGRDRLDGIAVDAPYLTLTKQTALSGTRCSAAVASSYAAIRTLGFEGYVRLVKGCMDNTAHLAKRAGQEGLSLALKPRMNIVNLSVDSPERLQAELDRMGWKVSKACKPKSLRMVVMPHVTRRVVDSFVPDLAKAARRLGEI
ncbi:MAG: tyrosine decarboxylase MfnA [Methanobacteriota archaeon]